MSDCSSSFASSRLFSHLYFSSRKHFSLLSTSFHSKGVFVFLTGGRRHVMASWKKKKNASTPLGQMSKCLWTILLIKPSMRFWSFDGLQMSVSRKEKRGRETHWRKNKSVPLFPKAMKRLWGEKSGFIFTSLFKMRFCLFLMKCDSLVLKAARSGSHFPLPVILKWQHFIYI